MGPVGRILQKHPAIIGLVVFVIICTYYQPASFQPVARQLIKKKFERNDADSLFEKLLIRALFR